MASSDSSSGPSSLAAPIRTRFVARELLVRDGHRTVFDAYDIVLRRKVVLEHWHLSTLPDSEVAKLVARARALARLGHAHAVATFDVLHEEGQLVVVMESVDGSTLDRWVSREHPPWPAVVRAFVAAGRGLLAAHAVGVVHESFSGASIVLTHDHRVVVTGFATARASGRTPADDRDDFCLALARATATCSGSLPRRVKAIIESGTRGLATDPDERCSSFPALLAALETASTSRRRWIAVAGSVATACVAGTGLWIWHSERSQLCSGGNERITETWGPRPKAAVVRAITASDLAYAPATADKVIEVLDRYRDDWQQQFRSACEATVRDGHQSETALDLRMTCLRRLRTELSSVVEVLSDADDAVVGKSVQLVGGLPPVSRCADVAALEAAIPPPDDPQVAADVDDVERLLVQARTLDRAGRYRAALENVDAAQARALGVDYRPMHARLAFVRGRILGRQAHYTDAMAALDKAMVLALEQGMLGVAAESTTNMAAVLGHDQGRWAEGMLLGRTAIELARAHGDAALEALTHNALGGVLQGSGRFADAAEQCREALALRRAAFGSDHPAVAETLANLGLALRNMGRYEQATANLRAGIRGLEHALGETHPLVANSRNTLGSTLALAGHHAAAESQYRSALHIFQQTLGPEHPRTIMPRTNLAALYNLMERYAEAQPHAEFALERFRARLDAHHPWIAQTSLALGRSLVGQGRAAEARPHFELAWSISRRRPGSPQSQAPVAFELARVLWTSGAEHRKRALELAELAKQGFAAAGEQSLAPLREVEAWLFEHGS